MKTTFLGQGFESTSINAVGNYLIKFLNSSEFHTFTGISAFASEAGIFGLSHHIEIAKNNSVIINLIVGIDQDGTSKEALEEINSLDVNSYIFYQSEAPIFHPKIYLFEGNSEIKLIVGSSNLTTRGLFNNVEGSLLIEFQIDDAEGQTLLSELKTYFQSIFDFSDPNLFRINAATIQNFSMEGLIPDEADRRKIYNKKKKDIIKDISGSENIKITIPKRKISGIPAYFHKKPRGATNNLASEQQNRSITISAQSATTNNLLQPIAQPRILVWSKLSLSRSDAQFVPPGTNGTGNLKLSQAGFIFNGSLIDHNTHFRNIVFKDLRWAKTKPTSTTYEETICDFDVTILSISYGIQSLKLSYDPVRISNQANTPSWLHWGNTLMTLFRTVNITGRTLNLYKSGPNFSIEII